MIKKKKCWKSVKFFFENRKKKISTFFFSSDFKKKKFTYDSHDFEKKIALTQLRTFLKSSETHPNFFFKSNEKKNWNFFLHFRANFQHYFEIKNFL